MGSAVDAFDHNGIYFSAEFFNRLTNFYPKFLLQSFGVTIDSWDARFDVRASTFEGCDYFGSLYVVLCSYIINDLRESRDVRGVEANQANPDGVFGDGRRED